MRCAMGVTVLLALVGANPSYGQFKHYVMTFAPTTSGAPPVTGSFDYDPATTSFRDSLVEWNTTITNLAPQANIEGVVYLVESTPCLGYTQHPHTSNAQLKFNFFTQCGPIMEIPLIPDPCLNLPPDTLTILMRPVAGDYIIVSFDVELPEETFNEVAAAEYTIAVTEATVADQSKPQSSHPLQAGVSAPDLPGHSEGQ